MKAKKRLKGHVWFHSGGGCSCGQQHNEESPRTEEERREANTLRIGMGIAEAKDAVQIFRLPGEPGFTPAKRMKKSRGSRGRNHSPQWQVLMRLEPCHYCGGPGGTIDHVIPRSQGGKDVKSNCVPACAPCNSFRSSRPYQEFKDWGWKTRPFAINRGDHVQEG